jgi:hypothetical protein
MTFILDPIPAHERYSIVLLHCRPACEALLCPASSDPNANHHGWKSLAILAEFANLITLRDGQAPVFRRIIHIQGLRVEVKNAAMQHETCPTCWARFIKKQAFIRVGLGGCGPGSSIADERPRSKQVAGDDYGKGEHW